MLYNNIDMSDYMRIIDVRGRGITEQELTTVRVIGSNEDYVTYRTKPPRFLEIDYEIRAKNKEELRKKIDAVSAIIETTEKVPIIFPDEPDMTYYGEYAGVEENVEYHHVGIHRGTIYILRDTFKYGPEKVYQTDQDTFTVENEGTAEADPIFELTVKEPTTFAVVSNGDEYMMVGRPYEVEETPFVKYERVFYSDASSTVGWTQGTHVDGGIVAGTMQSNGTRFEAVNYGTGSLWHGPAIKTSLPEVISDFRMETFIRIFHSNPVQVGRVEVYLLDTNNQVVGKVTLRDTRTREVLAFAEVRAGDQSNHRNLIYEYGDKPGNWNNFQGIMRLEREGNVWRAYVAMVDTATGRHHTRREVTWVDTQNRFTRNVAQVQVHMAQYGNHTPITGGVYSINIYKINQQQQGIPYIANTGDKITFDHVTGDCFINGEPVTFDFGADFFKLKKGVNTLTVIPENTFDTSVKYREKYL